MVSFVEPFAKEGEKKDRNDPLDYAMSFKKEKGGFEFL
jgi:hypothetical protein